MTFLLYIGLLFIDLRRGWFGLEKGGDRMKECCGKAYEDGGQHRRGKTDHKQEECQGLEGDLSEMKKLRKSIIELSEKVKVIMVLDHHCCEDNAGALCIKEKERNSIILQHPFLVFRWD